MNPLLIFRGHRSIGPAGDLVSQPGSVIIASGRRERHGRTCGGRRQRVPWLGRIGPMTRREHRPEDRESERAQGSRPARRRRRRSGSGQSSSTTVTRRRPGVIRRLADLPTGVGLSAGRPVLSRCARFRSSRSLDTCGEESLSLRTCSSAEPWWRDLDCRSSYHRRLPDRGPVPWSTVKLHLAGSQS